MSMSIATVMFMAIVVLFVRQGEVMQAQSEQIDMQREARFALDHLRRDLATLGSNSTPNSAVDPLVCPKPGTQLRALTLQLDGYVNDKTLNPHVQPAALTLFGSLDVKQRFRTASIEGDKVVLADDGKLPATQAAWDEIFRTDRYLRISGPDGHMMFFAVAKADAGAATVTVVGTIPRIGAGENCGFQGFGQNYLVDVQGFVRYRIVADERPGAPVLKNGAAERGVLVRERLAIDGVTPGPQLILAENAVDLAVFDAFLDTDPVAEKVKFVRFPLVDDVVQKNGGGLLGSSVAATPEALRAVTVKVSVRTEWPDARQVHSPRAVNWSPIETWQVSADGRGSHRVLSVATRVAMPTLVSRNL